MATTHQRFGSAASEAGQKAGDAAKSASESAGDMAKEKASQMGDAAKDMASRAGEAVKDTMSNVAQRTSDAAKYVGERADDAAAALGGNVRALAGTIRSQGTQSGFLGTAESAVANTLESAGRELEQGFGGMADDLATTIRRNPMPAILIAVGVGFLMARAFSSSSSR